MKQDLGAPSRTEAVVLATGYVLIVDIVGFSLRPTSAQRPLAELLETAVHACPAFLASKEAASLVERSLGDGILLVFLDSAASPVRCAEELLVRLRPRSDVQVRIGVHVGPVEVVSDQAYGDSINFAERACSAANPGEVLLTQAAYFSARDFPDLAPRLELKGEVKVKHGVRLDLYRMVLDPEEVSRDRSPVARLALWLRCRAVRRDPANSHQVVGASVIRGRLITIRSNLALTVFLTSTALGLSGLADFGEMGQRKLALAYRVLNALLAQRPSDGVTVVDVQDRCDRSDGTIDRQCLASTLRQVSALHPAAIAIDVNMGLNRRINPDQSLSPQDYNDPEAKVLETAKRLSAGRPHLPVFVACTSVGLDSTDLWFGSDRYADLAVHPFVPSDAPDGQIFMLRDLRIGDAPAMPSLAQRLASVARQSSPSSGGLSGVIEPYHDERGAPAMSASLRPQGEIRANRYLMNYEALSSILAGAVQPKVRALQAVLGNADSSKIAGHAVIIGSSKVDDDRHALPGGRKVSGVFIQAEAVYTLMGHPIRVLRPSVRWGADLIAGCLAILGVGLAQIRWVTRSRMCFYPSLLVGTALSAAAVELLVAVWLATKFRVLWADLFPVLLGMLATGAAVWPSKLLRGVAR